MEKKCANPRCSNTIVIQGKLKFCGQCQLEIRDFREQFPQALKHELECLFLGGEFKPRRAAALLGLPLGTFYDHCETGLVRVRREGRAIFIDSQEIIRLRNEGEEWLTLELAAGKTGISWQRLRTLVYKYKQRVPSKRNGHGRRVIRARHLGRIISLHHTLESTVSERKGKDKKAKPTAGLLSVSQAAKILDCHRDLILLRINSTDPNFRLKASKGGDGHWYIACDDFYDFCARVVNGEIKTIRHTQKHAQKYLDSIAAG